MLQTTCLNTPQNKQARLSVEQILGCHSIVGVGVGVGVYFYTLPDMLYRSMHSSPLVSNALKIAANILNVVIVTHAHLE